MLRCICLFGLLLSIGTILLGCATPDDREVSSLPWARPQSWEGAGPLGGYLPQQ